MRIRRSLITLAAVALATAVLTPASSQAAAPFPLALSVTASARTASLNIVDVLARSVAGVRCTAEVRAGRRLQSFASASTNGAGTARWRWEPVGIAADMPWRFTVTCRRGTLFSRRWISVEPGFPTLGGALVSSPPGPGDACDAQGVCFANDPFPLGQCTWYALGRRPDLLGVVGGNAGDWLVRAQGRVPEGWRPVAGALAVWFPHHEGMSADGHVAYVARVANGRILLDDSNWTPTASSPEMEVHEHWMSATSPNGYIYGGPAGAGP